jgi:hypothetical protein
MVLVLGRDQVSMRALVARLGIACQSKCLCARSWDRPPSYPGKKRNADIAICGDGAEGAETGDADVVG